MRQWVFCGLLLMAMHLPLSVSYALLLLPLHASHPIVDILADLIRNTLVCSNPAD